MKQFRILSVNNFKGYTNNQQKVIALFNNTVSKSTYACGVYEYAWELFKHFIDGYNYSIKNGLQCKELPENKNDLLNGATDWSEYSYGGCSLIYNNDIAYRLTPPSIAARFYNSYKYNGGTWLDHQAVALYRACGILLNFCNSINK